MWELRPIVSQLILDGMTILGFSYVTLTKPDKKNSFYLCATAVFMYLSSGHATDRWTIVFPMIPLLLFQVFRLFLGGTTSSNNNNNYYYYQNTSKSWVAWFLSFASVMCLLLAIILTALFPPVQLPPPPSVNSHNGPYNVGVVNLFLPVSFEHSANTIIDKAHDAQNHADNNLSIHYNHDVCPSGQDYVSVRILYPTTADPPQKGTIPHFHPPTSSIFCEETMKVGAPGPLKTLSWFLHPWRLSKLEATRHAPPLTTSTPWPIVVFSHGLGGNADLYSYQTMALAANGYFVVAIDHTDGSAPVVSRKDGTIMRRNDQHVFQEWYQGRQERYRQSRRVMTEYRAGEMIATVESIIRLNNKSTNLAELDAWNLSFVGKLNTNEIHYMGHSFGGATSLHAARLRPPASIIAHEPATEWIPDATRATLFESKRLEGSLVNYSYWQVPHEKTRSDGLSTSVHDQDMLVLFSQEWERKQWGGVEVLGDMHRRGQVGPQGGISKVAVISGAHHSEFSDSCMLTPTWLARAVGITGERSPLDTALEIHQHTMAFLNAVRDRKKQG